MNTDKLFTYVNDNDIDSFLNNNTNYQNSIVFLGSSGQIAAKNQVYGVNKNDIIRNIDSSSSYSQIPSAKAAYNFVYEDRRLIAIIANDLNNRENELYQKIDEITSNYITTEAQTYLDNLAQIEEDLSSTYSYINNWDLTLGTALNDLNNRVSYSYNFVTTIDLTEEITNTSTYSQYASAKATYNFVDDEHLLISAVATELNSRINSVASNTITLEAQTYLNSLGEATAYLNNAYSYIASFDYLYAAALTNLESRITQLETYHNN